MIVSLCLRITLWLLVFCCASGINSLPVQSGIEDRPLAVYLTWRHDPCRSMVVQWLTKASSPEDVIEYQKFSPISEGAGAVKIAKGKHRVLPEGHDNYLLHTVELTGLHPATTYSFHIPSIEGSFYKFKTMPDNLREPIRFVVGGDIYHDGVDTFEETNKAAAQTNPSFAVLGGDIAYGSRKRFYIMGWDDLDRWLTWLKVWTQTMVTPDGCLIPLLPAIGNHDVQGGYGQTTQQAPFFYALFPTPGFHGYNVIDFGRYMSLFLLDSGHTHPVGDEQTGWLDVELKQRKNNLHKFAVYHVGAYPSYRSQKGKISAQIRKWWVPVFEKYGLTAAFEHHDHTYKRTHLIKKDKIDPEGVLYLGDGAWGMSKPRKPHTPQELWYLANSQSTRQFILVTLSRDKRLYQAINPDGVIIDEYVQDVIRN